MKFLKEKLWLSRKRGKPKKSYSKVEKNVLIVRKKKSKPDVSIETWKRLNPGKGTV